MDLKISDLPPQFENIAKRVGIEKAKWLFEEFGVTSVYRGGRDTCYFRELVKLLITYDHTQIIATDILILKITAYKLRLR